MLNFSIKTGPAALHRTPSRLRHRPTTAVEGGRDSRSRDILSKFEVETIWRAKINLSNRRRRRSGRSCCIEQSTTAPDAVTAASTARAQSPRWSQMAFTYFEPVQTSKDVRADRPVSPLDRMDKRAVSPTVFTPRQRTSKRIFLGCVGERIELSSLQEVNSTQLFHPILPNPGRALFEVPCLSGVKNPLLAPFRFSPIPEL